MKSVLQAERGGVLAHQFASTNFRPVHPDQRHPYDSVHQHEGAGADAGDIHQRTEHDRQYESAQAAGQADNAADGADVVRVFVADVLEDAGFTESESNPKNKHQGSETVDVQTDVE